MAFLDGHLALDPHDRSGIRDYMPDGGAAARSVLRSLRAELSAGTSRPDFGGLTTGTRDDRMAGMPD